MTMSTPDIKAGQHLHDTYQTRGQSGVWVSTTDKLTNRLLDHDVP